MPPDVNAVQKDAVCCIRKNIKNVVDLHIFSRFGIIVAGNDEKNERLKEKNERKE